MRLMLALCSLYILSGFQPAAFASSAPAGAAPSISDVCGRSVDVQTAIVTALKKNCGLITTADLRRLSKLTVGSFDQSISLKPQDFLGLDGVKSLELAFGAKIQAIPARAFEGLVNLETLTLENLQLEEISRESFAGLPRLKEVNLSSNYIREIAPDTFSLLPLLEKLQLGSSFMSLFRTDFLTGLDRLKVLTVGPINAGTPTIIEPGAFRQLKSLRELQLTVDGEANDGHVVSVDWSLGLEHLEKLELNYGHEEHLKNFDLTSLARLVNLKTLSIFGIAMPNGTLRELVKAPLLELSIGSADVTRIASDAFASYPHLQKLDLGGNQLKVASDVFAHLRELRELGFRYAGLERVEAGAFRDLVALRTLDLSENGSFKWPGFSDSGLLRLELLKIDEIGFCGSPNPFRKIKIKTLNLGFPLSPRCLTNEIRRSVGEVVSEDPGS